MNAKIHRTALLAALLVMVTTLDGHQDQRADRVINILAERFSFTPSEIVVDQGSRVELRLESDDTTHGFKLNGPGGVDVEIPRRGRGHASVVIELNEPGTFVFECSRLCGAGHGFMRGRLKVRPRETTP